MHGQNEQDLSNKDFVKIKDEPNNERYEWPTKRELYTICGKLGEGASGNMNEIY